MPLVPDERLLADGLYLLAHDERGRSRVPDQVVDLGLAAALLGELMLQNRVTVQRARVAIMDTTHPQDALACTVLGHMVARRQVRDLRVWLALLAGWSFQAIGERLERQDLVVRTRKRWGRPMRFLPLDVDTVVVPADVLARRLYHQHPLTTAHALLLGLARTVGLIDVLVPDGPASTGQYLTAVAVSLPRPLRELVQTLQDAVAALGPTRPATGHTRKDRHAA